MSRERSDPVGVLVGLLDVVIQFLFDLSLTVSNHLKVFLKHAHRDYCLTLVG